MDYERTRYEEKPGATHPYWIYSAGASHPNSFVVPPVSQWLVNSTSSDGNETKTTWDWVAPQWKKRIAEGEIINHTFKSVTSRITSGSVGPFSHIWGEADGSWWYQAAGVWRSTPPAYLEWADANRQSMRQSVIDAAVTKAYANIDTSEMLALATIAESRKSVESMRAILWRLVKILKAVRKGDLRTIKSNLKPKEVADRYMEARYAIRPLIYDVLGIVKALEKEKGLVRKTFRGYASDQHTESDTLYNLTSGLSLTERDWERRVEYSVSARAGILCECNISEVTTWGYDQILESGWELLPLSFIVDWFIGIGEWIAAHAPNAGVKQLASWVTVKESLVKTRHALNARSIAATQGYQEWELSLPPGWWRNEELVLERLVEPNLSVFPSFTLKLDTFKITDLAIILKQLVS